MSVFQDLALDHGLNPPMAAILGMVSGIGGGMLRDILMARVPVVLRAEIYALAALIAAAIVVIFHTLNLPPTLAALLGATICFSLRLMAIHRGWKLPTAPRDPPA